jgi:hypothetical protein
VAPSAVGPTGTTGHGRAAEASRLRMPTLAPPAAGPARGPWASGGPEELRDSDRACGPFAVTSDRLLSIRICRSRSVMTLRDFLREHSSRRKVTLRVDYCRLNWDPLVLKQTARKLVSPVTTQSCVSLVDKVSSVDSQRSSRNSLQALLASENSATNNGYNNYNIL